MRDRPVPPAPRALAKTQADSGALVNGQDRDKDHGKDRCKISLKSRALAALAFDDLVALLQQALALAILAFLLLFAVGTFFTGHVILPAVERISAIERHNLDSPERIRDTAKTK